MVVEVVVRLRGFCRCRAPRVWKLPLSLDEFLRLPEIDERPDLEYIDGRIEDARS